MKMEILFNGDLVLTILLEKKPPQFIFVSDCKQKAILVD